MSSLAQVRSEPLDIGEVVAAVSRPEAGAIVTFCGQVRNHNEGQCVTLLEYEAYSSMAVKEIARIIADIEGSVADVRLAAVHRIGSLAVGDLAVVCAASAPHRTAAFQACELLIDRIKEQVPIWKREHGPNGPYWVGWQDARCGHPSAHHDHRAHATSRDVVTAPTDAATALRGIRVAVLTASDTRQSPSDRSGNVIKFLLQSHGAEVIATEIVPDDIDTIQSVVRNWANSATVDAIVINGGTGIAPRDHTIEAIEPVLTRRIDGFGEAFRRLSFDAIGPHALLSRALAGVIDACLVFALPGSPNAVELALKHLIIPVLPHACALVRGRTGHAAEPVP